MGIVCNKQRKARSCIKQLTVLFLKSAVFSDFFLNGISGNHLHLLFVFLFCVLW